MAFWGKDTANGFPNPNYMGIHDMNDKCTKLKNRIVILVTGSGRSFISARKLVEELISEVDLRELKMEKDDVLGRP